MKNIIHWRIFLLALGLIFNTTTATAFGHTEIHYKVRVLEQTGLQDLNIHGDLLADNFTEGGRLLLKKNRGRPIAIDCPGLTPGITTPRKLTNKQSVAGSCDGVIDWQRGFVRHRNGRYDIVDVPGSLFTDVYGYNERAGLACGQYFGKVAGESGFAQYGGFCWDGINYQRLDFPLANSVTALLGVVESQLIVGAYFTFDPATNEISDWTWFTLDQNGHFDALIHPSGFTYVIDVNKYVQALLLVGGGQHDPFRTRYAVWDDGKFWDVSFPTMLADREVTFEARGWNDDAEIVGDVTFWKACPPPTSPVPPGVTPRCFDSKSGFVATPK